ncbi:hypothetical protein [Ferrimonas sp. SCSIO 43195]|uniref:hypothetical protein n=1 Tax=Ferrimonas sp. SCSIO 43195 TaxID=2822844 RepID=UPI0020759DF0|nr:hypothetical protein [Ferrimonas sp. SCSIO 43195]USD36632.1 hypothetical protein J8Z22_16675 [Ferrimonas sp. SCSIO 43195]
MMRSNKLLLALVPFACLTLPGCGDSDDDPVVQPPIDEPGESQPADNVFGRIDPEVTLPRTVTLSIASDIIRQNPKWGHPIYDCEFNPQKKRFCNDGTPPAAGFSDRDISLMYTTTYMFEYDYILKDVEIDLTSEEWTSIRPEWFQDGQGSVLDLLLFAAKKYDLDVEYFYDEELDTYWIESINGVTGFSGEQVDKLTNHPTTPLTAPYGPCTEPGGWKFQYAVAPWPQNGVNVFHTEEDYKQIDRKPINNNGKAFFIPACKEEIELRKEIYRKEQQRLKQNGGKVIIPEVIIEWDWDKDAIFYDVEVTPHNMRTDVLKPGVYTVMDVMLSLAESRPEVDVHFNWWPDLSTGVTSNSYVMNWMKIDGVDDEGHVFSVEHAASGTSGFVFHNGELERANDSGMTGVLYKDIMCNVEFTGSEYWTMPTTECTGGSWRETELGQPGWKPPYLGDKVPVAPFGRDENGKKRSYFHYVFGGNDVHALSDMVVIVSPEYVSFSRASFNATDEFLDQLITKGEDIKGNELASPLPPELDFQPFDISKAKAPLTESHFGWKQPNCATCHDSDTNKGHVVDDKAPFECAECHGSNGAPKGHGEVTTCGFCHAKTITRHGDVYSGDQVPEQGWNEAIAEHKSFGYNKKPAEYFGLHSSFPEPASCQTCHPNE